MASRDKVIGALSGLVAAAIVYFLFVPECYTADAPPGTSGGGCSTRIGLESGVSGGFFYLAIVLSVVAFLCVSVIAAHVAARRLPPVENPEQRDLRW